MLDDVFEELKKYPEIFGKDYFISLFYVKGTFFKKLHRVCHSGEVPTIPSTWPGYITKLKHSSTGRAVKNKQIEIINFQDYDERCSLSALPHDLETWSKEQLSFRISIPFTRKFILPFYKNKETEKVYFVICINCKNRDIDYDNLSNDQKVKLERIFSILKSNCKIFEKYYGYYNNVLK